MSVTSYLAMPSEGPSSDNEGSIKNLDDIDRVSGETIRAAAKAPVTCSSFFQARIPILSWLPKYVVMKHLPGDLIAGITVGLMVIPQGLGYATVAGVPQIYGLYSAFMGVFMYAIFGGCKDISVGPTAILSLLSMQANGGDIEVAIQMTFLSGLVQMALATLHLGMFVDFISNPVLSGFTSASAIQICLTQLSHLCGYKTRDAVYYAVYDFFHDIKETRAADLLLGIGCMFIIYFLSTLQRRFPNSMLARQICIGRNALIVMITALISYLIECSGREIPWKTVGHIPSGMPPVESPIPSSYTIKNQMGHVFLSALVGFLESIAIAKAFARKNGYSHRLSSNQELFAIGTANVVGSFFRALPVTGSFSRTAVASQAGARTPVQGIITGVVVILALVLLTPAFAYIPTTTLAAVVVVAAGALVDLQIFVDLWRLSTLGRLDLISLVIAFFGCLFLDIEYGIALGIGASLGILLFQMARPPYVITDPASHAREIVVRSTTSTIMPDSILLLKLQSSVVFFNIAHLTSLISRIESEQFELVPMKIDSLDTESEEDAAAAAAAASTATLALQSDGTLELNHPIVATASLLPRMGRNDLEEAQVRESHQTHHRSNSAYPPLIGGGSSDLSSHGIEVAAVSAPFDSRAAHPGELRPCRMRILLLDCSCLNVLDTSGARGLYQLAKDLGSRPIPVTIHFASVQTHVRTLMIASLDQTAFPNGIENHIHETIEQAVANITRSGQ